MPSNSHRGFPTNLRLFERQPAADISSNSQLQHEYKHNPSLLPFTSREVSIDLLGGITKVGEYYLRIVVGGQPIRVQVDTGSSTLAFPVAECRNCEPSDQRYNPLLSKTGKQRWISCMNKKCARDVCTANNCSRCSTTDACCAVENPHACLFQLRYGDGSGASGGLMVDEMSWGNVSAPVIFGAILTDINDFERSLVDGILGMAYESLACNPTCVEPPFQQMVKAGVVDDQFSICITPQGGKLILGAFDPDLATSDVSYVPLALSDPPTFYTMNVSSELSIGKGKLSIPDMKAGILDSGTTLIVVSSKTFTLIRDHLLNNYCDVPGLCHTDKTWFQPSSCVALSDEDINKLPPITFHLGSAGEFDLELRAQDYMLRFKKSNREYRCVGIMEMAKLQKGTDIIFGNTVMQRYVTHYDRRNKRLGFAEAISGCGGSTRCTSYVQCQECASAAGCSFDFLDGKCRESQGGLGLIPYPECSGNSCFCKLGPRTGLVFGTLAGFLGMALVVALIAFVVTIYQKRGRAGSDIAHSSDHTPLYSLGEEEDGDDMVNGGNNNINDDDADNNGEQHPKRYVSLPGND